MDLLRKEEGQEVGAAPEHGGQGDTFRANGRPIHAGEQGQRLLGLVGAGARGDDGVPAAAVPLRHLVEQLAGVAQAAAVSISLDCPVEEEDGR